MSEPAPESVSPTDTFLLLRLEAGGLLPASLSDAGPAEALTWFLEHDAPGSPVSITRWRQGTRVSASAAELLDAVAGPVGSGGPLPGELTQALGRWLERRLPPGRDGAVPSRSTWPVAALQWAQTFRRPAEDLVVRAAANRDWALWPQELRDEFTESTGWLTLLLQARDTPTLDEMRTHTAALWVQEARQIEEFAQLIRNPAADAAGTRDDAAALPAEAASAAAYAADLADWCIDQAVACDDRAMSILGLLSPDLTDVEDNLRRAGLPRSGSLSAADSQRSGLAARARRTARDYVRLAHGLTPEEAQELFDAVASAVASVGPDDPYAQAWLFAHPSAQRAWEIEGKAVAAAVEELSGTPTAGSAHAGPRPRPETTAAADLDRATAALAYALARLQHLHHLYAALGRLDAPYLEDTPRISSSEARSAGRELLTALFGTPARAAALLIGRAESLRSSTPGTSQLAGQRAAERKALLRAHAALLSGSSAEDRSPGDAVVPPVRTVLAELRAESGPSEDGLVVRAAVIPSSDGERLKLWLGRPPADSEFIWRAREGIAEDGRDATFVLGVTDTGLVSTVMLYPVRAGGTPRPVLLEDGTSVDLAGGWVPSAASIGAVFPEYRLVPTTFRSVSAAADNVAGLNAVTAQRAAQLLEQHAPRWRLIPSRRAGVMELQQTGPGERTVVVAGSPALTQYTAGELDKSRGPSGESRNAAAHLRMAAWAAVDLRLVGLEQSGPSKLDSVAEQVAAARNTPQTGRHLAPPATAEPHLQIIIAPARAGGASPEAFDAHRYLATQLQQRGIPAARFATWPDPAASQAQLDARARSGELDVLIVTQVDAGWNLRGACAAVHDVSAPVRPALAQQRERIQGLLAPQGALIHYTTEGSVDAGLRELHQSATPTPTVRPPAIRPAPAPRQLPGPTRWQPPSLPPAPGRRTP